MQVPVAPRRWVGKRPGGLLRSKELRVSVICSSGTPEFHCLDGDTGYQKRLCVSMYSRHARYNSRMRAALPLLLFCLSAHPVTAEVAAEAGNAVLLSDLAARADVVALAQARDTDYLQRREIPVSGSAYLRVLIPYKTDQTLDLVEVYEKGLHENECYFPNPTVFEEGRRYLLFLKRDPEEPERYRGLPEGCALDVLVDSENRYAVRYPVTGIELADPLKDLARPMTFRDSYAVVEDSELAPALRNALLEGGYIEPHGEDTWRYTHGIGLTELRRLIAPEALAD